MKIYVASSWRNLRQPEVVRDLREHGHSVYDFKHPSAGDAGFSWRECVTESQLRDPERFRDEVLTHAVAQAGFAKDMDALRAAEACVLVLPCGRSAHLELGWAAGAGQTTIGLLDDPLSEPELMYLMNTSLAVSLEEVCASLQEAEISRRSLRLTPNHKPLTPSSDDRVGYELRIGGVKSALRIDRLIAKERVRCLRILDATVELARSIQYGDPTWEAALEEARERIRRP